MLKCFCIWQKANIKNIHFRYLAFCSKDESFLNDTFFYKFQSQNNLDKTDVFNPIQIYIDKKIFWHLRKVDFYKLLELGD